jgi:hypothetical protein
MPRIARKQHKITSEETKKLQLLRADKDYTDKKLQQLLRAGMRRRK